MMINRTLIGTGWLAAGVIVVTGCTNPLARTMEQELQDELRQSMQAYKTAIANGPILEPKREDSQVEIFLKSKNLLEKSDELGGPSSSYKGATLDTGRDLVNDKNTKSVAMTLQRAIELSVRNNLDVKLAQIIPAISETQVTQAEAVFDAVFFSEFNFQGLDTPQPPTATGLGAFGSVQQKTTGLNTGIRKVLSTGGQLSVSSAFNRNERQPSFFAVNSYYDADILVSLTQPLLRNFGSDVTRSQILLSENARDEAIQDLRSRMLEVVANTEQSYWQLVFARQQLFIQQRLYAETIKLRTIIGKRLDQDARIDSYTDALSREELRRADLIRARASVRQASDALKQLIYAKDLTLSSETLINPLEAPPDLPMSFSLLDSVTTALQHRPELRRALLEIKDSSIRERVADNQRLPRLDLALSTRFNGVGLSSIGSGYEALEDGDFIDYIAGFQFEVPIGNRGPEAALEQRRLERRATVINYRRIAQQVVKDVKDTMRALDTSYEVIGATRSARRAAADRLRVLIAQDELTPDFVDLQLRAQETLAAAEIQEVQAMSEYNTAIARYYQAMGTLLERNGINFDDNAKAKDDKAGE